MPNYDYVCTNCGLRIEVTHPVQGHGPTVCTNCGGPMRKAVAAAAVHFKGSGWARKERSSGSRSERAGSGEKSASSSDAGKPSTGETDKAPAADTAAKDAD